MNAPVVFSNAPLGFGAGGPLPAPSPWISYGPYILYNIGGVVIGNPNGGNMGLGTLNANNFFINGISINPNNFLQLTGGTITGNLTINGNLTITPPGKTDGVVLDMGTF